MAPNTKTFLRSFSGGEMSPEMFGRIDDPKFQTGAARLRNFITRPQGPAFRRPGLQYVATAGNSGVANSAVRLLPFTFSTTQTLVIEMGGGAAASAGYFRFHTSGASVLAGPAGVAPPLAAKTSVSISNASPAVVTWASHPLNNNDPVIFGAGCPTGLTAGTTYYVRNKAAGTFEVSAVAGVGPSLNTSASGTCTAISGFTDPDASVFRLCEIGDVVSFGGTNYYCKVDNPLVPPVSTANWYAMPASGVLEVPHDFLAGDLFAFTYVQSGDILTLANPNYSTRELRRYGATKWVLAAITFGATLEPPASVTVTPTFGQRYNVSSYAQESSTTTATDLCVETSYAMQAVDGDAVYIGDSPITSLNGEFWILQSSTGGRWKLRAVDGGAFVTKVLKTTFSNSGGDILGTCAGHGFANGTVVGWNTTGVLPVGVPSAAVGGYIVSAATDTFKISTTLGGTPTTYSTAGTGDHYAVIGGSGIGWLQPTSLSSDPANIYVVTAVDPNGVESVASSEGTTTNNLFVPGASNLVSWPAVSGAKRYRIYKKSTGLFGYIGQVDGTETSFVDDNIGPDLGVSPPIADTSMSASGYPAAVGYFDQRRVFAATHDEPQSVWMTKAGTESDLSYSLPTVDSDRIYFRIAARQMSDIRHIVPLGHLMLLASSAEYRVTPVNSDALTPSSVSVRPQSYIGANYVQPIVVNNTVVYCAARGGHVREMGFRSEANGYVTGDLSLRAAHLFDSADIVDLTHAKAPLPILWFVSSTGDLLGLTYVPEENVGAWHWHDTDGEFLSCAAVAEGDEDRLYVVVERTINASTVTYIERMGVQAPASASAAFHVDAGITSTGTTITGLNHLEGETVAVLADGVVQSTAVVASGSITLAAAATTVHVGLPYTSELQTLPMTMQLDGFGHGRTKNVNKVWVRVADAMQFQLGPTSADLVDAWQTDPTTLQDDQVEVRLTPTWSEHGQLWVQVADPTSLTVVSVALEVSVG